jgi:hypothetical protein
MSISRSRLRRHAAGRLRFLEWLKAPYCASGGPQLVAFIDFLWTERGLYGELIEGDRRTSRNFWRRWERGDSRKQVTLAQLVSLLFEPRSRMLVTCRHGRRRSHRMQNITSLTPMSLVRQLYPNHNARAWIASAS